MFIYPFYIFIKVEPVVLQRTATVQYWIATTAPPVDIEYSSFVGCILHPFNTLLSRIVSQKRML